MAYIQAAKRLHFLRFAFYILIFFFMPKIFFKNKNRTVDVEKGTSVLEAALCHDVALYHTCGGNCSCSTCRVLVLKGAEHLSQMEDMEAEVLDAFDLGPPHRLGCQTLVMSGAIEVEIPDHSKEPRPNKTPPLPE